MRSLEEENTNFPEEKYCGWHWSPLESKKIQEVYLLLTTVPTYFTRNGYSWKHFKIQKTKTATMAGGPAESMKTTYKWFCKGQRRWIRRKDCDVVHVKSEQRLNTHWGSACPVLGIGRVFEKYVGFNVKSYWTCLRLWIRSGLLCEVL